MTMNKKELQMVEDLKTQLALKFTEKVDYDIPTPQPFCGAINGYSFNSYSKSVYDSCSSSCFHGTKHGKIDIQQGIRQFSKKSLAAKAMRNEVEEECARKLRSIDIMIEKFESEELEQVKNETIQTKN